MCRVQKMVIVLSAITSMPLMWAMDMDEGMYYQQEAYNIQYAAEGIIADQEETTRCSPESKCNICVGCLCCCALSSCICAYVNSLLPSQTAGVMAPKIVSTILAYFK